MKSQNKGRKPRPAVRFHGITFRKPARIEAALTHPSYRNENPPAKLESFDRLEFFGDSILNFVICRKLYALFPEADEGILSKLRSILVSKKILARIAKEIFLGRWIKLGKSLKQQRDFSKSKVFADCFEAVLAAIFFDHGLAATERFILKHFQSYLNPQRLFRLDPNPKSTLQEISQKHWQKLPVYTHEMGARGFKTTVMIHRSLQANAHGKNRKEAEEKAARLLVRKIRQELLRRSSAKKRSSGRKLRKTF